jgi:hypothetical protein
VARSPDRATTWVAAAASRLKDLLDTFVLRADARSYVLPPLCGYYHPVVARISTGLAGGQWKNLRNLGNNCGMSSIIECWRQGDTVADIDRVSWQFEGMRSREA